MRYLPLLATFILFGCSSTPPPANPTILVLGKTKQRMQEVLSLIADLGPAISAFREEEALRKLAATPSIQVILLGGAVEESTRQHIRAWIRLHQPNVQTSEPGVAFDYSDSNIRQDLKRKLR
jgi:hypothetical protein